MQCLPVTILMGSQVEMVSVEEMELMVHLEKMPVNATKGVMEARVEMVVLQANTSLLPNSAWRLSFIVLGDRGVLEEPRACEV